MRRAIYEEEHDAFRATIREFIAREVVPHYPDWEKVGRPPRELFRTMGELGVMGFGIPEEYGGPGDVGYRYQAVIDEEAAFAGVMLAHQGLSTGIVLPYLLDLANDEQKRRWLPGIASGEILLCIAMSEPGTGSDLAGMRTTATRSEDGSHYLLNGSKTFISGSRNAELCIVVARTSPATAEDRRGGLSLLVVPTDSPGFSYGRMLEKIGLHTSDTNELNFVDVAVPVENLLGEEGKGFSYLASNLSRERLSVAVDALARAQAAIRFAADYVRQRTVYGATVSSFQNTKFVLASCDTEVTAGWAAVDRAIALEEAGELTGADAARVKLFATEVAARVVDQCLQLHGGYGYMLEYPIARLYADVRVNRIYGGTSEVMKSIIAKDLGL